MIAMYLPTRQEQSRIMKQPTAFQNEYRGVLLFPEDIRHRTTESVPEARLVDEFDDRGTHIYVYSTNVLEWLLARGYNAYVLTPQPELRKEDEWWLKLIPADSCVIKGPTTDESHGSGIEPIYHPWITLFRKLGIKNERLKHTGEARDRLREHGILFADDIRTLMTSS